MIEVQDITIKVADLKELIQEKIAYPYLQKHIQASNIDEDRLILLSGLFEGIPLSTERVNKYILTVMLIQIALDTHENVSNSNDNLSNDDLKIRQLTVLAGDYYSGLYYYYLAEMNDIDMVKTLAEAIKDINENKIILYQKDADDFDHLMRTIEIIESALVRNISVHFECTPWESFASKFLLLKRLLIERKTHLNNGFSLLFNSMSKLSIPNTSISDEGREIYLLRIVEEYIVKVSKQLESIAINNPQINQQIIYRLNQLIQEIVPMKKMVEEG